MTGRAQSPRDLVRRLSEAEATIAALVSGQVDAVVDTRGQTPILLSKAQAALRESEERYRRIVETTSEGVWAIDASFKTTFINARMAEMLGSSVPAVMGHTPMEFLDSDGLAAFTRTMDGLRAGITAQHEVRFVRRDGADLWALLGASPILDANGRFAGSLAMVMDVTNRKRTEGELRLLETLMVAASAAPGLPAVFDVVLRMICELTGWAFAAAWVPDREASRLICSRSWGRAPDRARFAALCTTSCSVGEGVVGRACASRALVWVHDLATEPACPRSATAARLGLHAGLVVPVISDDHVIAVIEFFTTAPGEPDTRFVQLVSAVAPQLASVMARKAAEASLVERVRVATLGSDVGLALIKPAAIEDVLQHCAEAMVSNLDAALARIWTLRRPAKDVLELRASAGIYTNIDDDEHACVPIGKLEIGLIAEHRTLHVSNDILNDPWTADAAWARREGLTAFAGFPLIVADELVGVMAIFARHDLSAIAIDGLASVADAIALSVQHKLVERANAELEAQLLHAQKMEAVGRLAGGIAHDFNNLLSVILSYSELMVEELPPDQPMHEYSEEICKAGHRAADLTRQLLMFSRQQVVEPKVLDLNEVVAGMAKMLPRILGADIEQVSLLADSVGRVCIDRGSIEQVIMNLVVNARDAMPTGGTLTVETANIVLDDNYARAHVGVTAGPHVMLAIGDTGQGMDAATQAHIFEPFFTTKPLGKGTGLGLSTVFGIVHQGGGSVGVESEVGRGTTFRVLLPQVDAPLDIEPPIDALRTSLRGSETILVVEDDEQVRVLACGILRRYGYKVIEAASPGDAMLICESVGAIDLLLSDVVMPQMSGPVLAKRLAMSRPEMKILCMSGYTDDSIIRHGVHEGEVAFIQKPITRDMLTKKVRDLLDDPPWPRSH